MQGVVAHHVLKISYIDFSHLCYIVGNAEKEKVPKYVDSRVPHVLLIPDRVTHKHGDHMVTVLYDLEDECPQECSNIATCSFKLLDILSYISTDNPIQTKLPKSCHTELNVES